MAKPIVQPPEGWAPGRWTRPLKIFFDGGCQPNPGKIEVAVVTRGQSHFFDDLGRGTSSDAEWLALRLPSPSRRRWNCRDSSFSVTVPM